MTHHHCGKIPCRGGYHHSWHGCGACHKGVASVPHWYDPRCGSWDPLYPELYFAQAAPSSTPSELYDVPPLPAEAHLDNVKDAAVEEDKTKEAPDVDKFAAVLERLVAKIDHLEKKLKDKEGDK